MTTRRSFFSRLAVGIAAFSILPSALTYARTWKPMASGVVVPLESEFAQLASGLIIQMNLEFLRGQLSNLSDIIIEDDDKEGLDPVMFNQQIETRYLMPIL